MNSFYEMLSTLLTVGGVGIINYIIAEQLEAVDTTQRGTNREKALSIVFTMLDFILYLGLRVLLSKLTLKGNVLTFTTAALTVIISLLISFKLSKKINELFYHLINRVRGQNYMSYRRSATNWQSSFALHGCKNQLVYLYDFDHNPLGWGWRMGISNDKESNYSISLMPQFENSPENQDSYEEITKMIQQDDFRKDFAVINYINFQQKFIAIICNDKDSQ